MPRRIRVDFEDIKALRREFEQNLTGGGLLLSSEHGLSQDEECDILLIHPVSQSCFRMPARVVWVQSGRMGVAIDGFGAEMRDEIFTFIEIGEGNENCEAEAASIVSRGVVIVDPESVNSVPPPPVGVIDDRPAVIDDGPVEADDRRDAPQPRSPSGPPGKSRGAGVELHERLRGLSAAEQIKVARGGELTERIVLERIYGKTVWEALLRNPKVTIGEVARIAKMGNLPLPIIDLILSNMAWLANGQVRRALLGNPRLTGEGIQKILRSTPKHELKNIPKQTAYSMAVRAAAKKILGQSV